MRANLLSLLAGTTILLSNVCTSHARRSHGSIPTRCRDLRDESTCERLISRHGCDSKHVVNVCARTCRTCSDVCAEDYEGCHPACGGGGRNGKCCDAIYGRECKEAMSRGYCKEQHPKHWVGLALCQETCRLCDDFEESDWRPPSNSAHEPQTFSKSSNGLVVDEVFYNSDSRSRNHEQKNAEFSDDNVAKSAYEEYVWQKGHHGSARIEAKVMVPQAKILQPGQKFGVAELPEAKILQPSQKLGVAELPEAKILRPGQKFGVAELPEAKILRPDQKFAVVSPSGLEGKTAPEPSSQSSEPVAADNTTIAENDELPWYTWVIMGVGAFILLAVLLCACYRTIANRRKEKLQRMSDRYYDIAEANPKTSLKSSLSMKAHAADNSSSFSDGPLSRSLAKDSQEADYNTVLFDKNASPHQF